MAMRPCRSSGLARAGLLILAVGCAPTTDPPPAAPGLQLEFRIGKPHGLLNFVQAIAGDRDRSTILVELFRGSAYDTPEVREQVEAFHTARESLFSTVQFPGFPDGRYAAVSLNELLLIRSGSAVDLADFRERTAGLMPLAEHRALFDSLAALEPVYDALVWDDSEASLRAYRDRLASLAEAWNADGLFARASTFYGARWPDDTPFVIALYPLPGASGHSTAQSIGSFESVGILLEDEDVEGRFGVLFHELCHSLYAAQPRALQHELERWFAESDSPYAGLAYEQLNEALATSLGNGWAREAAAGEPESGAWYDDDVIDGFAKALHPTVLDYLGQARTIDEPFVSAAIRTFAERFPDAIYRYDLVLNEILLLADGREIDPVEAGARLRERFRVSGISRSTPIGHENTVANVARSETTVVVLVSQAHREQLGPLAAAYPVLEPAERWIDTSPDDGVWSTIDPSGRAWIVVRVGEPTGLGDVFDVMQRVGRVDPDTPGLPVP